MKSFNFFLITSFLLTACASSQVTATPSNTNTPTQTSIPPNEKPVTPTFTSDPLAGSPEGTTGKDEEAGEWIKIVKENGNTFEFRWNEEQKMWTRALIENRYLWDAPDYNAIPLRIYVAEGVPGADDIVKLIYNDVTSFEDQSPVTKSISDPLKKRLNMDFDQVYSKLQEKAGIKYDLIIQGDTEEGQSIEATFGPESGFNITIVSPEDLEPLVESKQAFKINGERGSMFIVVDGVDEVGNVNCRIASSIPLDELKDHAIGGADYELRYLFFVHVANILGNVDQRNVHNLTLASILAVESGESRANGNPDVEIVKAQ
jgi:hypothetical protein